MLDGVRRGAFAAFPQCLARAEAQPRFAVRELLGDRTRAGAGGVRAARERGLERQRAELVVGEHRVDGDALLERQRLRLHAGGLGHGPQLADHAVRVAERHALGDERVGQFDREQVGRERRGEAFAVRHERGDRRRQRLEQAGEQACGLAPRELEQVRVALLRQQRAARAESVGRREPAERRRAREYEVLGEPREVQPEQAGRVQVFEREVAVAHGVERVRREPRESQSHGEIEAVVHERRARDRARAERQAIGGLARRGEALFVALERGGVRQPEVREQDGLRGLQVRVRGAGDRLRLPCLHDERSAQRLQVAHGFVAQSHDAHAEQRGDLVVPAAAGVQPSRGFAAKRLEPGFDGRMHVFTLQHELAAREPFLQFVARAEQAREIGVAHDAAGPERGRVRARHRQLLGPQALVHGQRVVQSLRARIEAGRETTGPNGATLSHASPPPRPRPSRAGRGARRWRAACRTAG